MSDLMRASELARQVEVKQSTIDNWTKRQPPLESVIENGRRMFSMDAYVAFAAAHPRLRGVARHRPSATSVSNLAVDEVRDELRQILVELHDAIQGSEQTQRSTLGLKQKLEALVGRLEQPPTDEESASS